MHPEKKVFSRLALAFTLFVGAACGPAEQPGPPPQRAPQPQTSVAPPETNPLQIEAESYPPVVWDYFPEIIGVWSPQEEFRTSDQKLTVISFDQDVNLDPQAILKIYQLFKDIHPSPQTITLNDQSFSFSLEQKTEPAVIFITPPDAPLPSRLANFPPNAPSTLLTIPGETSLGCLKIFRTAASYFQNPFSQKPETLANLELYRTLCQVKLVAHSADPQQDSYLTAALCQSLAEAIIARQTNTDWFVYRSMVNLHLSEDTYSQIPELADPLSLITSS